MIESRRDGGARPWPTAVREAVSLLAGDLLGRARGRVLDLGNGMEHLAAYAEADVVELAVLAGLDDVHLERRAAATGLPLRAEEGPLETLLPGSFDTVVSVFSLISVVDLTAALTEVSRVMSAGGALLLVEPFPGHRSLDRALGVTGRFWRVTHGLHLRRAIASAVREEGFVFTDMQRMTVPTSVWPLRNIMAAVARSGVGLDASWSGGTRSADTPARGNASS